MVTARKLVDVDKIPELSQIVDEIQEVHSEIVLVRNGKASALVTSLGSGSLRDHNVGTDPQKQLKALRASAGGWRGLVDGDKLIEDIYASRELLSRPLPEF